MSHFPRLSIFPFTHGVMLMAITIQENASATRHSFGKPVVSSSSSSSTTNTRPSRMKSVLVEGYPSRNEFSMLTHLNHRNIQPREFKSVPPSMARQSRRPEKYKEDNSGDGILNEVPSRQERVLYCFPSTFDSAEFLVFRCSGGDF